MKKLLLYLLAQVVFAFAMAQDPSYPAPPPAAQQINYAEYFIDNDPGFGNGTPVSITAGTDIANAIGNINVTGLTNGVHRLFLRVRSTTGIWSLAGVKDFLYDFNFAYGPSLTAPQQIVAAEYFVDTDPGFGLGTAITITPGTDLANVPVTVNTTGLGNGTHRLYIRAKNAEGSWSLTAVKDFILDFDFAYPGMLSSPQNIAAAEYFFDTDPGFGQGTSIAITPGIDLANVTVAANTASLSLGTHRLYIRAKSAEGKWSLTGYKEFIVSQEFGYPSTPAAAQNIIGAEYFIDTDPGFGLGTSIAITPGLDISNLSFNAVTTALPIGTHRIYLRTKNQEGSWSLTGYKEFIVSNDFAYPGAPAAAQNIIAAEYFVDTDPGFGAATPISITPATNISNLQFAVNTSAIGNGQHTVYLRTKNQEGRWSLTAHASFFTDLMQVTPDTIHFGNVPSGISVERDLTIKNNSTVSQTINGVSTGSVFTTNASLPLAINAGESKIVKVQFAPVAATNYLDSVTVTTTSGTYKSYLKGTGISPTYSWLIAPIAGHNYGNVTLNTTANYSFTIYNNSNVPLTLSAVTTQNALFVPSFTAGTVIPANGSLAIPVAFTPTAVGSYTAQLKIESSTAGVQPATTMLYGTGYTPGTPPVLQYVSGSSFNGTAGVNPAVGNIGLFTYKILYKSANNKAPLTGYPKVSIDLNGNQTFNDLNEGTFAMVKEGSSTDYINGVVYTYSFSHSNFTSLAGYKFDATDEDGNAATSGIAYKSGPVVTNQVLDLRIFANDISFSKANPKPGETFTMTARITNATAVPASNVPVKYYRDSILLDSTVVPTVGANSYTSITRNFNFASDGFYPIKVWIDSSQTLGESNVLNNYAIRPITVGTPNLPGGITVTTQAVRQECPTLMVTISGHAEYYGTGTNTPVAGAEVTINTGTQSFTTTTDANGNYSTLVTGLTCGSGNFAYAVTVTDFTFTSSPASNSIPMPCPAANACTPPVPAPSLGGMQFSSGSSPCSSIAGGTGNLDFTIKIRERDLSNMWSGFDEVLGGATLKVFMDGVLFETREFSAGALAPGQQVTVLLPWQVPSSTTPVTITAELVYTYVEYEQIPNTATIRPHYIVYTQNASKTITPQPAMPDLTVGNFAQTSYTAFRFDNINQQCVTAGSHTVKVYDNNTLVQTTTVAALSGKSSQTISYSNPALTPGVHTIKIVTDADGALAETDELNNEKTFTITVAAPDLIVTKIVASPSTMNNGIVTNFIATIKNTGKATGGFNVKFSINGGQIGSKIAVAGIGENAEIQVSSNNYTVGTIACTDVLEVFADSDGAITDETNKANNIKTINLNGDLTPYQLAAEAGSAANPAQVRVNNNGNFFPAVRNLGIKDVSNVLVHYMLNGVEIASETLANVKAGEAYAAHGAFTYMFATPGLYTIRVVADSLNTICESDESNNAGNYYIKVVDSKPDLEVLSQYISPSLLNPVPSQNITIVGTVRNAGGKVSAGSVMRFFVDDVQLGNDVPFNAIQPGKDTTVMATANYSSLVQGTKIMKIVVDPTNALDEENELNNAATRALIVGEAPDMAKQSGNAIKFNPNGFSAGDSVTVSYSIINNGSIAGTAWVRFLLYDKNGGLRGTDSVMFSLNGGASTIVSRKMYFDVIKGKVVAQIVNCSPIEYNLLNNDDTLSFSTIFPMPKSLIVNGNLDLKHGLPDDVPGWIGGKLLLGDFDLTVNGNILNSDASHFIVTNGTGKLKLANNNAGNLFPVATDTTLSNFVYLHNSGTSDNFSVRVVPYVLVGGVIGDTVKSGVVNRTWFIDEQTPGGSNVHLRFNWYGSHEQSSFDRSNAAVAHYLTNWQMGNFAASTSDSIARFSRVESGFTSFSPFTITSPNSILPIQLLHFTASKQQSDALLQWKTSNAVNSSHFEIEHAVNGTSFSKIGLVAAINGTATEAYSFIHRNLAAGNHFYRLKMVDLDGSFSYSSIRQLNASKTLVMQAFPNPASNEITITGIEPGGELTLMTINGQVIRSVKATAVQMKLNISNLPSGVYHLRYTGTQLYGNLRFFKE